MDVLFGTTNPAKINSFAKDLQDKGINVLTLKDVNLDIDVEETGKDALENACIKAKAYYDATGITSIGMDNTLFFENVSEEEQPGTHVRRVNNIVLTDEQMIEHYTNISKKYGGKINAKWCYAISVCTNGITKNYTWNRDGLYIVDKPSDKIKKGYPLDSISIEKSTNRYLVDIERKDELKENIAEKEKIINFILQAVK